MVRISARIYTSGYRLKYQIEHDRRQLVELAASKGFQHREVIHKSQYLDELLNDYYQNNP